MRAAEKTAYSDVHAELDEVLDVDDVETSTPDHTTTSDPDITVASHLAVQERAFSEDNVRIQVDSSDSGSNAAADAAFDFAGSPDYTPQRRRSDVTPHSSDSGTLLPDRRVDSSSVVLTVTEPTPERDDVTAPEGDDVIVVESDDIVVESDDVIVVENDDVIVADGTDVIVVEGGSDSRGTYT